MNKWIFGLIGAGIGVAAAAATMYFKRREEDEFDFWDGYDDGDETILVSSTEDILIPFSNDATSVEGSSAPDIDNHQNDLA